MAKVSVIVPVYNVEKYIKKCLDSLVNQTLQDIEIIIVNDGSTDNSEEIINKYIEEYSEKIKYVTKPNGGLSDARNYGMKFASGDYIAFLDSDDYADITLYEKMYNRAKQDNCDFVECDFIWKYDDREVEDIGKIYKNKHEMIVYGRVMAWNKLIKKSLIQEKKLQFPKGLRYEDIEFFLKLAPHVEKVGFVKECLIYYVQRKDSIIYTQNDKNKDIFDVFENSIQYYKENGLYDEYKVELEYKYLRTILCSSFYRIVRTRDRKIRKKLLKMTWEKLNTTFPNWKKNTILQEEKCKHNTYIKSVNSITFWIYAFIGTIGDASHLRILHNEGQVKKI